MYARVTGVFVFGDALESDTWNVTLLIKTCLVVAQSCSGVGFFYNGRREFYRVDIGNITALRYRDEILAPIVRPFLGAMGDNARLVQDNARPHTTYVIQDYIEQESIETIDWPARSPGP